MGRAHCLSWVSICFNFDPPTITPEDVGVKDDASISSSPLDDHTSGRDAGRNRTNTGEKRRMNVQQRQKDTPLARGDGSVQIDALRPDTARSAVEIPDRGA